MGDSSLSSKSLFFSPCRLSTVSFRLAKMPAPLERGSKTINVGFLLPGAPGSVHCHSYYLNRWAVLHDSKKWWNNMAGKRARNVSVQWGKWDVDFTVKISTDKPKGVTLPCLLWYYQSFCSVCLLIFFFYREIELVYKINKHNLQKIQLYLQIPAATSLEFRSTSTDKSWQPNFLWIMVNSENGMFLLEGIPTKFYPCILGMTVPLTCILHW